MSKCERCNEEFKSGPKARDKRFCSKKCQEKTWVENNRKKNNLAVRKYRAKRYAKEGNWRETGKKAIELREWMNEIKSKPCTDCGFCFPICAMDFDHKKGTKKEYNIGSMFAHHYSRERIEKELEKCELVCSNCHRVRTRNRRTGSGKYRSRIQDVSEDGEA